MKIKFMFLLSLCLLLATGLKAQDPLRAYKIGEKSPDFIFSNLLNYPSKTAKFSDFRGKLVILDFWNTGCSPCIAAFPKLDSLRKAFAGQIEIITVTGERRERIQSFIDRMASVRNIRFDFPFETGNRTLKELFPHIYVPHEVWIGPEGTIIATTDGKEITAENIRAVLEGKKVDFRMKTDNEENMVELSWSTKPGELAALGEVVYSSENDGRFGVKYHSVLTRHIEGVEGGSAPVYGPQMLQVNTALQYLYSWAYGFFINEIIDNPHHGPVPNDRIIREVEHPETLYPPDGLDSYEEWTNNHTYCYALELPEFYDLYKGKSSLAEHAKVNKKVSEIMIRDLAAFTGYHSGIETKKVMCRVLKVIDPSKLGTKGGEASRKFFPGYLGASYTNLPISKIIGHWEYCLRRKPLIDETNYKGNIDMELDVKMTDAAEVDRALRKYGLTLVEEERELPMLVISDR